MTRATTLQWMCLCFSFFNRKQYYGWYNIHTQTCLTYSTKSALRLADFCPTVWRSKTPTRGLILFLSSTMMLFSKALSSQSKYYPSTWLLLLIVACWLSLCRSLGVFCFPNAPASNAEKTQVNVPRLSSWLLEYLYKFSLTNGSQYNNWIDQMTYWLFEVIESFSPSKIKDLWSGASLWLSHKFERFIRCDITLNSFLCDSCFISYYKSTMAGGDVKTSKMSKPRMGVMLRQVAGAQKPAHTPSEQVEALTHKYKDMCQNLKRLQKLAKERHVAMMETLQARDAVRIDRDIQSRADCE